MVFPHTPDANSLPIRNPLDYFSPKVTPEDLERLRTEPLPFGEDYRLPLNQRPDSYVKYDINTREPLSRIGSKQNRMRPDALDQVGEDSASSIRRMMEADIQRRQDRVQSAYPRPYGRVDDEGHVLTDKDGNPTPGYTAPPQEIPIPSKMISALQDEIGGTISPEKVMPINEVGGGRLGAALDKMGDQRIEGDEKRYQAYDNPLETSYGRFLENLDKTGQDRMDDYYRGIERDYETGDVKSVDYDAGKQRFIDDTLETDQNSPQEQLAAANQMMKATHEADNNKVMDFDENTGYRPGVNRQMTNDARGTRIFESQLDQKHIPERFRDEDKNMVATNMFDPETGEPGIAGQSPTMVGEGMPKRSGASLAYGPPGLNSARRGMDMGDQHGRNGSGDGDANYMLGLMTEDNWNSYSDQDRRDLVMNLANRLGYLDGIKELPEEDQYYAAKRAVFSHIFQTGNGAQKIWANDEAELGRNSALIDPNAKPLLENVWDENRGQWVLSPTADAKERAEMRRKAAYAAKRTKDFSQISQYLDEDGNYDPELVRAAVTEVLGPRTEENAYNWDAAMKTAMANVRDGQQHLNVRQNTLDQGRGQAAMGNYGNSAQWRNAGSLMRQLDEQEPTDFLAMAALARNHGRPDLVNHFMMQAEAHADRQNALDLADKQAQAGDLDFKRKEELTALENKGRTDAAKVQYEAEKAAERDAAFLDAEVMARNGNFQPIQALAAREVGIFRNENGREPTFDELMGISRTPRVFEALKQGIIGGNDTRQWIEFIGMSDITPEEKFERYNANLNAFTDLFAKTLGLMQPLDPEMAVSISEQYDRMLIEKYGPDAIPKPVPVAPTEETATPPVDVTTETKQSTDTEDLDGTGKAAPTAEEIKKKIKEAKQSAF